VPDWLEEMSTGTVGVGGFTGGAGRFEARDTRRGNVRHSVIIRCFVKFFLQFKILQLSA